MAPKKQVRNGFITFAFQYREDQERLGRQMPQAITELIKAAGPAWQALSQDEKDWYNQQAKGTNKKREKLDCTGCPINEVDREMREKLEEENQMIQFISKYVHQLGSKQAIGMEKFYLISFNIFCKTLNEMYLPAEVGLVEFSLLEGITNSYHTFIDPGDLPLGSKYDCKEKSERTHKIPWLGFELAEMDYSKIFHSIVDLIDPNHNLPQYPPIYCLTAEIPQTKELLNMLSAHSTRRVDFTVMDFAQLFYELYVYLGTDMISVGILRDFLMSSTYTYRKSVSCEWHWENDCVEHCSLGVVQRSCFILFDYLCDMYGVNLVMGRHLPSPEENAFPSVTSGSQRSSSAARTMSSMSMRSDYRSVSRDTSHRAPTMLSRESSHSELNYYTASTTPQFESASGGPSGNDQPAWGPSRTPIVQSFSSAAASLNQSSNHDFHMNREDFPGLGRGHGGARPRDAQQRNHHRTNSESSHESANDRNDPRMSSRNSNNSGSSYAYHQRRNPVEGFRREFH